MDSRFDNAISERIIKLRKENHLSQDEFAEKLGVTRQSVSKWECGESVPEVSKIILMSEIFDVPTDFILKKDFISKSDGDHSDNNKKKYILSIVLVVISIVGFIVLPFLAESRKYTRMVIYGSSYANSLNYLLEYPLCILLFCFCVCFVVGLYLLIIQQQSTKY